MEFDFALAQDIGTRSEQQDSAAVCPFDRAHGNPAGSGGGALFVIADGLGGHTGGARASHIVVKAFADAGESGRFKTPQDRYEQLGSALSSANDEIAAAARSLAKNETMGTTLVAAAAAWNSVGWISIGDSHLYLWRAGTISKLNEDHSQAGQMIKSGRYKPDDPELDAYRSMLRSAIMGRELTLIDRPIETMELQAGDILVLATDGLNVVELADVEKIIAERAAAGSETLANALLDAVRASGAPSRDNATVIVARVVALDGAVKPEAETGVNSVPGDASQEAVTTAIVTTPFFKTGQPRASITQLRAHAAGAGRADGATEAREKVAEIPAVGVRTAKAAAEAERNRGVWIWLSVTIAVAAAALAWFVYQRILER
jgi:PPM family protein phosphatase